MSFMQLILDLSTIKLFINHRKICRSNQFGCQAFRAKSKDLMSFAGESWREELSEEFKSLDLIPDISLPRADKFALPTLV